MKGEIFTRSGGAAVVRKGKVERRGGERYLDRGNQGGGNGRETREIK